MPTPTPVQLGQTVAEARSGAVSLESITNLYLERNPAGAKGLVTLYGTPGLKPWLSGLDGGVRGIKKMGASLYVVAGNYLYRVDSTKTVTELGYIEGSGNVHMTNNGIHVAVAVVGGKLYAANATSGVLELPESNMNGATAQDGYGIFSQAGTEKFWITGLDDMTTIGPLDFSTADAAPDTAMGIISDHRELLIAGQESFEWWYNSGDASFPFARAPGGYSEHGGRASGSLAKAENTVFWLGNDLAVYGARGYVAEPLSPPWVEALIAKTTDPGSAWAFTYRQLGHIYYVLTFSDLTLAYDLTAQSWHRRKSKGIDRWRANGHAFIRDQHIVGDYATGNLYELDLDTYTDNGDAIRREVTAKPLHAQGSRATMSEFYVDMEMGVGLASGQGSDPQLMLDWCDDGRGAIWSNELSRSAGATGEGTLRATWNRLGSFRQRTLRLAISDPVKVAIIGAYARVQGLAS